MGILSFVEKYKWFLILYLLGAYYIGYVSKYYAALVMYVVILILVVVLDYKKKIDIELGFALLYRTGVGVKFIEKFSSRHKEWVKFLGYVSTGVGFLGMIAICILLPLNIIQSFMQPEVAGGASFVVPGLEVPGIGVLSFFDWLFAIFFIVVVHEFSHGIVSSAYGVNVVKTGLALFGPFFGAFVEPDESKLVKTKDIIQYSVYSAGSFSNFILAIFAVLLIAIVIPIQNAMVEPSGGFTFDVASGMPAEKAGIKSRDVIYGVNGIVTNTYEDFAKEFQYVRPNQTISLLVNNKNVELTTVDESGKARIGITNIENVEKLKYEKFAVLKYATDVLARFLRWLYLLSLGIGMFNLLPLPIVDGGRMLQALLVTVYGKEKGFRRFQKVSMFFAAVLIIIILMPLILKLYS